MHMCNCQPLLLRVCFGMLQVSDLYDPRTQWASYIINAIKAKELFVKDVNYIVKKAEVRSESIWLALAMESQLTQALHVQATWHL